ncbi:MAG: hypothetical protein LQ347_004573 [Umbilicaria vellea]|nr:MAG: hypothetical protein LQ347_004573 [Umbilicaria vellea]
MVGMSVDTFSYRLAKDTVVGGEAEARHSPNRSPANTFHHVPDHFFYLQQHNSNTYTVWFPILLGQCIYSIYIMRHAPIIGWIIVSIVFSISVLLLDHFIMLSRTYLLPVLGFVLPAVYGESTTKNVSVDLSWHAPNATQVNSLASAINGTGVYGFIFNSSVTPGNYKNYNWCNMPHVRPQEYPKAPKGYELEYVELSPTPGTAATKVSSSTASPSTPPATPPPPRTGASTPTPPTRSRPKASTEPANSPKSREAA